MTARLSSTNRIPVNNQLLVDASAVLRRSNAYRLTPAEDGGRALVTHITVPIHDKFFYPFVN